MKTLLIVALATISFSSFASKKCDNTVETRIEKMLSTKHSEVDATVKYLKTGKDDKGNNDVKFYSVHFSDAYADYEGEYTVGALPGTWCEIYSIKLKYVNITE